MTALLLVQFVTILVIVAGSASGDCPTGCECKWKGGKQTVECVNASLTMIPNGIDRATQVLDLSFNAIPVLQTEIFLTLDLPNLQKIFMANAGVKEVQHHCFRGLTNLVELDLSNNGLSHLPKLDVQDCKYLMKLTLRGNHFAHIEPGAFADLRELQSLDLAYCGIEDIADSAFNDLNNLNYLRLEGNKLKTFNPMERFSSELRDLTLHGNLWHCDCRLLALRQWLQAVPQAKIQWSYRNILIQNGSTLIDNLDLRHYFHIEEPIKDSVKSTLYLPEGASLQDNGTFACLAENKAGKARAEYTLHVVVPMPPKPPQDVVEEHFNMKYLIALVVASVSLVLFSLVMASLLWMKCRPSRRRRKRSIEQGRMIRSRSSATGSCADDSLATQMTSATNGMTSSVVGVASTASTSTSHNSFTDLTLDHKEKVILEVQPDIIPVDRSSRLKRSTCGSKQEETNFVNEDSESNSGGTDQESYHEKTIQKLLRPPNHQWAGKRPPRRSESFELATHLKRLEPRSVSILPSEDETLSPPTPFADINTGSHPRPHHCQTLRSSKKRPQDGRQSKTLPRKPKKIIRISSQDDDDQDNNKTILPPPPQYKGVHFAPEIPEEKGPGASKGSTSIPLEGLPTRPAASRANANVIIIPTDSETVPIMLRGPTLPPAITKPPSTPGRMSSSSSMTFRKTSSTNTTASKGSSTCSTTSKAVEDGGGDDPDHFEADSLL